MSLAAASRYESQTGRWIAVLLSAAALHIVLLCSVSVRFEPIVLPERALVVNLEYVPEPALEEHSDAQAAAVAQAAPAPSAVQSPVAPPASAAPLEKLEDPSKPSPQAEKEPLPESEPEALPKPADEPLEAPLERFVDARGSGEPEATKNVAAADSRAADLAEKNKPVGDPSVDGESRSVAWAIRRGENEMRVAAPPDVRSGSAATEGAPDPGSPPKPLDALAKDEMEKDAGAKTPPQARESEPPPAKSRLAESGTQADESLAPAPRGKAHKPAVLEGEPDPGRAGGPEGKEGGETAESLAHAGEPMPPRGPDAGTPEPRERTVPEVAQPSEHLEQPNEELTQRPSPVDSGQPDPAQDPELARLRKLMDRLASRAAHENALPRPGEGPVKGEMGVAGDGMLRAGQSAGVSDVLTENHATVAAHKGEVSFGAKASPEAAYLKPYLGQVNDHWKRILIASRMRYESGYVTMRFTIAQDGKVTEAAEVRRGGDVTDTSVAHCKRALENAPTPGAFPPNLGRKTELTWTVTFLY